MIYECMMREEKSTSIFYNADQTLKKGLQARDPTILIKGLDDMIRFIYDLVSENTTGGKKTCPLLTADK